MYGMYGYDPRMGDPGQSRARQEREPAPVKFTEVGGVQLQGVDCPGSPHLARHGSQVVL